jgi:multidrug resistance efflux pump
VLVALLIAGGLALAGWSSAGRGPEAQPLDLVTTAVWKGPYEYTLAERGTVECGSSTEIRCLVRSRNGTAILEVVPEGSFVQAGDIVVELDRSELLEQETAQKILVATRESQVAQAENTLHAAEIAKLEYLEGLFVAQESALISALFVAQRTKEAAEVAVESAKALHLEGIFTVLQVQAAYASLEDALNKFDAADTALRTLRDLTKRKESALLAANIASAEANVQAQRKSLRLEQERLAFLQEQIANCTIRATAAGQVVYASDTSSYRSSTQSQFIVEPGVKVRQWQTILWLPNPKDMQVRTAVNEAHITMVQTGMPVTIRVPALPDMLLDGEVTHVSQYAEPTNSSTANIRQYATIVKIKNPPADLRVGMNADLHIHLKRMESALQVPVQALAESQGRFFSLVKCDEGYETREIQIGSTNDQVATIEMGLDDGDEVVMNPRSTGDLLELPDWDVAAQPAAPEKDGERNQTKRPLPDEANAGGG